MTKQALGAFTLIVGISLLEACGSTKATNPVVTADAAVDRMGNIHVPADYRTKFSTLGTFAIADEKSPGSKEMHIVYASPETISAFRKDGKYPDGAVLVKEVYATHTGPQTTGTVSHADTLKGWFVMIKDSGNTHPGNKLWGDGWGWSWFDANAPRKTTSTDYKAECLACHEPARQTDLTYTAGYPVLRDSVR